MGDELLAGRIREVVLDEAPDDLRLAVLAAHIAYGDDGSQSDMVRWEVEAKEPDGSDGKLVSGCLGKDGEQATEHDGEVDEQTVERDIRELLEM